MYEREINRYLDRMVDGHQLASKDEWKGFRCVLFDMDGVLYNSMPNHAVAWQQAMSANGLHFTAEDSYATEGMKGVDTIRIYAERQTGKKLTEAEAQAIYDEKARLFHQMPEAGIFDGVVDLMKQIREAGLTICVVTGSGQKPLIQRLVNDFGDFIDKQHIVSAYNVSHGKPAPDPYLKGLELAGNMKPWEGIVVENAPMGVRAGVAAQIFTIGVNSGPLPDEVLAGEGANVILPSIRRLADDWQQLMAYGPAKRG